MDCLLLQTAGEERTHMPAPPKADLQASTSKETVDVNQKKRELEDHIKTVDSLHNSLTENAAQREIEAYKTELEEKERHKETRK
jgi:TorA maturation chaperone TorD